MVPRPIVVHKPSVDELPDLSTQLSAIFPFFTLNIFEITVDISDFFSQPVCEKCELSVVPEMIPEPTELSALADQSLKVCKEDLIAAQTSDLPSLVSRKDAVMDIMQAPEAGVAYFLEDGVLRHRWKPQCPDSNWQEVHQNVLPSGYRSQVLQLAHEKALSGHLGVTKTFHRISKYLFWPGLKSCVSRFVQGIQTKSFSQLHLTRSQFLVSHLSD